MGRNGSARRKWRKLRGVARCQAEAEEASKSVEQAEQFITAKTVYDNVNENEDKQDEMAEEVTDKVTEESAEVQTDQTQGTSWR